MTSKVETYADALYAIAAADDAAEVVEDEVFQFARAVESNEELRATLNNPALPAAVRQQIVTDILGQFAHPTTQAVLALLVGTGRVGKLGEIATALAERQATKTGQTLATVRTAVALNDDQINRIAGALSQRMGHDVAVKNIVDPTVVGGVLAEIGDDVIDGTIRSRLTRLREAF